MRRAKPDGYAVSPPDEKEMNPLGLSWLVAAADMIRSVVSAQNDSLKSECLSAIR